MIYLPRFQDIILPTPVARMAGLFRLRVHKPGIGTRIDTGWFPNLITKNGLNEYPVAANIYNKFFVGSGSTAPNENDTSLEQLVAETNDFGGDVTGAQSEPPYYSYFQRTRRFQAGEAAGNLAEVGVGDAANNLFSRALILDENGDPTTITVLADEVLDVSYEIRLYPPTDDLLKEVTISGQLHDTITRASRVTSSSFWAPFGDFDNSVSYNQAYSGDIQDITSRPAGSGYHSSSVAFQAYSADSFERVNAVTWGLNNGNVGASGIRSIMWNERNANGSYQTQYEPRILKDDTKVLTLNFKTAWARRVLLPGEY
mgnify:CR=1 FL=1